MLVSFHIYCRSPSPIFTTCQPAKRVVRSTFDDGCILKRDDVYLKYPIGAILIFYCVAGLEERLFAIRNHLF